MKRYIQFKKIKKEGADPEFLVGLGSLKFPMDHPITFMISNEYFTPVPKLIEYITNTMADGPLNFVKAFTSGVDTVSKLTGVSVLPRNYYAKAWKETQPLSFTISIDLNFGWRGFYNSKIEVKDIVDALIDESLPTMERTKVGGAADVYYVKAPGPTGADTMMTAVKQLTEQIKQSVGPVFSLLIPDRKKKEGEDYLSPGDVNMVCMKWDARNNTWFVYSVWDETGNIRNPERGALYSYDNGGVEVTAYHDSSEIGKEFVAGYEKYKDQADATFERFTREIQSSILPESYIFNVKDFTFNPIADQLQFAQESFRANLWTEGIGGHNGEHVILVPLDYGEGYESKKVPTGSVETADLGDVGMWEVTINGRIVLKNLVLDSLTHRFGNEQDENGQHTTATVNLNFITQNIPVAYKDYSGLNIMEIK